MLRTRTRGIEAAVSNFRRLDDLPDELRAVIGAELLEQTKTRVNSIKRSPDGAAWDDWTAQYARTKKSGSMLERSGRLLASIDMELTPTGASVGTSVPYARRQNFRRPFIGASAENVAELRASALDFARGFIG